VPLNSADSSLPSGATGESSSKIPVDVRRFPWIRRLAADYAYDFGSVSRFFAGDPRDRRAWADVIARAQGHSRARADIARVLAAQQQHRGAPSAAREAARALADADTVVIVTGQQAGLFGGPLFTLLKAATAMKLAAHVEREHGVRAIPVFWIDAEDHDWDEVRSCTVLDDAMTPRTVALPPRPHGADPVPAAAITLGEPVRGVVDELDRILPKSEFHEQLVSDLRSVYRPDVTMVEAFGTWLERVLGPHGLVVFDASDADAKPLARDVFVRELTVPGETARLAALAGAELVARGYHSQAQVHDDAPALFRLDDGRHAVRRQDTQLVIGERSYAPDTLLHEAEERPSGFSPNVLLRPIVQDTLFPTICYVAGPNELAYLAQLRSVYRHFDVPMPIMFPRASATILDSAAFRFISKYSLPIDALHAQDEAALNALLKSQIPAVVEQSLADAGMAIERAMERVVEAMPALDPTLEGTARSTLGRMQHDLHTLHGKAIQAAKRRDETLRRQFIRTRALAFPSGHPQERTINIVWFLNQYGPATVQRLMDELPLDVGHHWVVAI
jgi:bacillithiol biosynthesis cysteine-adding enzyme BshC